MDLLHRQGLPAFQIFDQSLQVVLQPRQSLRTNENFIIYSSPSIKRRSSQNHIIFQNPFACTLRNKENGIEFVGLSKPFGGRIVALNPSNFFTKIVIRVSSILAYTSHIRIVKRSFYSEKGNWAIVHGEGLLFIQQPGTIIEKKLRIGEAINLKEGRLLGFTLISTLTPTQKYTLLGFGRNNNWASVNVEGPGTVFIQTHNTDFHREIPFVLTVLIILVIIFLD